MPNTPRCFPAFVIAFLLLAWPLSPAHAQAIKQEAGVKGSTIRYYVQNDGRQAKMGDYVKFHFKMVTDSMGTLTSTYQRGEPNTSQLPKDSAGLAADPFLPALSGAAIGDSMMVELPTDSMYSGRRMPPQLQSVDSIRMFVRVLDIFSAEEGESREKEDIMAYINEKDIEVEKTKSGLRYEVYDAPTDIMPKQGDSVRLRYTLTDLQGDTVDQTPADTTMQVVLGEGQLFEGFEEGLMLMPLGSRARLIIPSELAMGHTGRSPMGGPFKPFIFDVQMISINGQEYDPSDKTMQSGTGGGTRVWLLGGLFLVSLAFVFVLVKIFKR